MESPKNAISDRERDAAVERLLREAMSAEVRTETPQCLDVETLAAWSEGTLTRSERASAESHAASCARCQAMLAAMARTAGSMPTASVSSSASRRWLVMLGPAVAAAAAVALWFAVDRRAAQEGVSERPQQEVASRAPAAAPPPAAPSTPATPSANEKAERQYREAAPSADNPGRLAKDRESREADALPKSGASARPQALADASSAPRPQAAPVEAPAAQTQSSAQRFRSGVETPPAGLAPPQTPPPPPAPALLPPPQQTQQQPTQQQPTQQQPTQQAAGNRADQSQPIEQQRLPEVKAVGAAAGRGGSGGGAAARAAPARDDTFTATASRGIPTFEVVSPDTLVRWRVVDGGLIQRSKDGGVNWVGPQVMADKDARVSGFLGAQTQTPPLTAGVAPSTTVVWLVGRGGVVLLTTDGNTWRRVKFPELVDLVRVTATDARIATVTSADGRTFQTADGGASWAVR